ncbi:FAD-dependent oxidoreductase [uncultured Hyphomicrobium sp.]|jgi:pyridine nucleotide-disulfide oxidoreductase family protein|uniref:FAD-dependent oxidoreductase n=1 Tax=uncultured Hyphomicrobium sp. TaxID=194373 RepID=UPI0025EBE4A7|nr:FAD-dependent oxidoreductase [uncultured Hyphomicrobium sp.]
MKRLLLVGAGHANAQVLRSLADAPLPDVEVTVVTPNVLAPYSGMVPGWLSGAYDFSEICVDFGPLAAAAGATLVVGELRELAPDQHRATLANGVTLDYDVLSLNVGSTLNPPDLPGKLVLSLRPLGRLRQSWETLLAEIRNSPADSSFTVTAVGGGAAGVEALLGCLARLRALQPNRKIRGTLATRGKALLPGLAPGAVRAAHKTLANAGVTVLLDTEFNETIADTSDLILWATGAQAHDWQRNSGLALSDQGFIRIDEQLRSVSHPNVYAVGDCAEWDKPLPKAGVYAVRMGPFLVRNLRAALGDGSSEAYKPQRNFLVLLATGDHRAIASRGGWSAHGALLGRPLWHWKDHIDRKFLNRFVFSASPKVAPHSQTERILEGQQ